MRLTNLLKMFFGMFFLYADEGSLLGGGAPAAPVEGEVPPVEGLVGEGWLSGSRSEFANDPIMANVKDLPTLVQNYVNAQRMVGKKGLIPPDENSGEDKWNEFYTQLGRPADAAAYGLAGENLDDEFVNNFAAKAHQAGLLPQQAKQLMDFYNETAGSENTASSEEARATEARHLEDLRAEWGEGFETKIHKAVVVAKQFGGEELIPYLDEKGLGSDPMMLKFLANIGESLNEDSFEPSAVSNFRITPEQAQEEITGIMEAKDSPYWKPDHQDHFKVTQRIKDLYKIIS